MDGMSKVTPPYELFINEIKRELKDTIYDQILKFPCLFCGEDTNDIISLLCVKCKCTCYKCKEILSKEKIFTCSKCKVGRYCSIECQKTDWKEHSIFCKSSDITKRQYIFGIITQECKSEVEKVNKEE